MTQRNLKAKVEVTIEKELTNLAVSRRFMWTARGLYAIVLVGLMILAVKGEWPGVLPF